MKSINLTQCVPGGDKQGRSGYLIKFEYDIDFIEDLKRLIPHIDREWNPITKTWWISEVHSDKLAKMFGNFEALTKLQGKLF